MTLARILERIRKEWEEYEDPNTVFYVFNARTHELVENDTDLHACKERVFVFNRDSLNGAPLFANAAPSIEVLETVAKGIDPTGAVLEGFDNSVQACNKWLSLAWIFVVIATNVIVFGDNGKGMSAKQAIACLKLGLSENAKHGGEGAIGLMGIGLKQMIRCFGSVVTIITKEKGTNEEHVVEADFGAMRKKYEEAQLDIIEQQKCWKLKHSYSREATLWKKEESGTRIIITNLDSIKPQFREPETQDSLGKSVATMYHFYLRKYAGLRMHLYFADQFPEGEIPNERNLPALRCVDLRNIETFLRLRELEHPIQLAQAIKVTLPNGKVAEVGIETNFYGANQLYRAMPAGPRSPTFYAGRYVPHGLDFFTQHKKITTTTSSESELPANEASKALREANSLSAEQMELDNTDDIMNDIFKFDFMKVHKKTFQHKTKHYVLTPLFLQSLEVRIYFDRAVQVHINKLGIHLDDSLRYILSTPDQIDILRKEFRPWLAECMDKQCQVRILGANTGSDAEWQFVSSIEFPLVAKNVNDADTRSILLVTDPSGVLADNSLVKVSITIPGSRSSEVTIASVRNIRYRKGYDSHRMASYQIELAFLWLSIPSSWYPLSAIVDNATKPEIEKASEYWQKLQKLDNKIVCSVDATTTSVQRDALPGEPVEPNGKLVVKLLNEKSEPLVNIDKVIPKFHKTPLWKFHVSFGKDDGITPSSVIEAFVSASNASSFEIGLNPAWKFTTIGTYTLKYWLTAAEGQKKLVSGQKTYNVKFPGVIREAVLVYGGIEQRKGLTECQLDMDLDTIEIMLRDEFKNRISLNHFCILNGLEGLKLAAKCIVTGNGGEKQELMVENNITSVSGVEKQLIFDTTKRVRLSAVNCPFFQNRIDTNAQKGELQIEVLGGQKAFNFPKFVLDVLVYPGVPETVKVRTAKTPIDSNEIHVVNFQKTGVFDLIFYDKYNNVTLPRLGTSGDNVQVRIESSLAFRTEKIETKNVDRNDHGYYTYSWKIHSPPILSNLYINCRESKWTVSSEKAFTTIQTSVIIIQGEVSFTVKKAFQLVVQSSGTPCGLALKSVLPTHIVTGQQLVLDKTWIVDEAAQPLSSSNIGVLKGTHVIANWGGNSNNSDQRIPINDNYVFDLPPFVSTRCGTYALKVVWSGAPNVVKFSRDIVVVSGGAKLIRVRHTDNNVHIVRTESNKRFPIKVEITDEFDNVISPDAAVKFLQELVQILAVDTSKQSLIVRKQSRISATTLDSLSSLFEIDVEFDGDEDIEIYFQSEKLRSRHIKVEIRAPTIGFIQYVGLERGPTHEPPKGRPLEFYNCQQIGFRVIPWDREGPNAVDLTNKIKRDLFADFLFVDNNGKETFAIGTFVDTTTSISTNQLELGKDYYFTVRSNLNPGLYKLVFGHGGKRWEKLIKVNVHPLQHQCEWKTTIGSVNIGSPVDPEFAMTNKKFTLSLVKVPAPYELQKMTIEAMRIEWNINESNTVYFESGNSNQKKKQANNPLVYDESKRAFTVGGVTFPHMAGEKTIKCVMDILVRDGSNEPVIVSLVTNQKWIVVPGKPVVLKRNNDKITSVPFVPEKNEPEGWSEISLQLIDKYDNVCTNSWNGKLEVLFDDRDVKTIETVNNFLVYPAPQIAFKEFIANKPAGYKWTVKFRHTATDHSLESSPFTITIATDSRIARREAFENSLTTLQRNVEEKVATMQNQIVTVMDPELDKLQKILEQKIEAVDLLTFLEKQLGFSEQALTWGSEDMREYFNKMLAYLKEENERNKAVDQIDVSPGSTHRDAAIVKNRKSLIDSHIPKDIKKEYVMLWDLMFAINNTLSRLISRVVGDDLCCTFIGNVLPEVISTIAIENYLPILPYTMLNNNPQYTVVQELKRLQKEDLLTELYDHMLYVEDTKSGNWKSYLQPVDESKLYTREHIRIFYNYFGRILIFTDPIRANEIAEELRRLDMGHVFSIIMLIGQTEQEQWERSLYIDAKSNRVQLIRTLHRPDVLLQVKSTAVDVTSKCAMLKEMLDIIDKQVVPLQKQQKALIGITKEIQSLILDIQKCTLVSVGERARIVENPNTRTIIEMKPEEYKSLLNGFEKRFQSMIESIEKVNNITTASSSKTKAKAKKTQTTTTTTTTTTNTNASDDGWTPDSNGELRMTDEDLCKKLDVDPVTFKKRKRREETDQESEKQPPKKQAKKVVQRKKKSAQPKAVHFEDVTEEHQPPTSTFQVNKTVQVDEDMMMESPLRVMQHLDVPGMAVEEEENDAFDSE